MHIKTCCIIGHRKLTNDKADYIKSELRKIIVSAVNEGYSNFISGLDKGIDLYFAEIIIEIKEKHCLTLEPALPYRNRIFSKNAKFKRLINKCNMIEVFTEAYSPSCYLKRNQFMVRVSDLVIAVYDGHEKGDTYFTIKYVN